MITPQYTYDHDGKKVGVFLPIEDWNELNQIPAVKELSHDQPQIPDWHVELGRAELRNIADGTTELIDWSETRKQFNL